MALEQLANDAMAHFGGGITVALVDYVSFIATNPKEERIAKRQECVKSIELVLDNTVKQPDQNQPVAFVEKDSLQYAKNVETVRKYFMENGKLKMQLPFGQRFRNAMRNLMYQERINNLGNVQKLGVAAALEFGYDSVLFGSTYYTHIMKVSPIAALATNLYQIPMFFAGLWTGNIIKKGVNWFVKSGDEKKLDRTIDKLTKETPILDLVLQYKAPEQIQQQLKAQGVDYHVPQLTMSGKTLYKSVGKFAGKFAESTAAAADSIIHYGQRQEEERKAKKEEAKKTFDELTKGR
jgi:hypothetical protein